MLHKPSRLDPPFRPLLGGMTVLGKTVVGAWPNWLNEPTVLKYWRVRLVSGSERWSWLWWAPFGGGGGDQPPPPFSGAESLEAPKVPMMNFGLN